jgi:hypothetical protein
VGEELLAKGAENADRLRKAGEFTVGGEEEGDNFRGKDLDPSL